MDLDDILAAEERLAGSDEAVALRLARTVTDSESAALALWDEAQARAAALAGTIEFQRAVRAVAQELLVRCELDGDGIDALTERAHSN